MNKWIMHDEWMTKNGIQLVLEICYTTRQQSTSTSQQTACLLVSEEWKQKLAKHMHLVSNLRTWGMLFHFQMKALEGLSILKKWNLQGESLKFQIEIAWVQLCQWGKIIVKFSDRNCMSSGVLMVKKLSSSFQIEIVWVQLCRWGSILSIKLKTQKSVEL